MTEIVILVRKNLEINLIVVSDKIITDNPITKVKNLNFE